MEGCQSTGLRGWCEGYPTWAVSGGEFGWSWLDLPEPARQGLVRGTAWRKLRITHCLPEPNPATNKTQWHADDEPDYNQRKHGTKGHSTTGSLGPDKQIKEEERAEYDSRNQQRGHDNVALPSLATKGLVCSRRNIATDRAKHSRYQEDGGCQKATIGRRQKTEERECYIRISLSWTFLDVR